MQAWQFSRRRGRPRGEQKANKNHPDLGTPQVQARRAVLAGGADPALSEHPLGLLLARGLIAEEQHRAACAYAWLYGRAVGRTAGSCARLYRRLAGEAAPSGWEPADNAEAALQERFRRGKNRLLAAGRRVCDATENIVIFGRAPRFLDAASQRGAAARRADAAEREAVLAGLAVLAACYGSAAGRAGRMEAHRPASLREAATSAPDRVARPGPAETRHRLTKPPQEHIMNIKVR
jgi:hypothetical protein